MQEDECRRLLEALLRDSGVPWEQSGVWTRFRFREGVMVWELACRCRRSEVLIYSRYPMAAREWAAALEACGEANGALTRGAMFLQGETPGFSASAPTWATLTARASGWQRRSNTARR